MKIVISQLNSKVL